MENYQISNKFISIYRQYKINEKLIAVSHLIKLITTKVFHYGFNTYIFIF